MVAGAAGMMGVSGFVAGCVSVGPDYKPPAVDIEEAWQEAEAPSLTPDAQDGADWWAVFDDPVLGGLVDEAYGQNLTLRAAAVRVLEARARLGIAVGKRLERASEVAYIQISG